MAGFNINPGPQAGSGAYGAVPGVLSLPPDIYSQVMKSFPGLTQTGTAAAGTIGSEVQGQIAPDVQRQLQDKAAALSVSSGAGGGPGTAGSFGQNTLLESLGLNSQQQQQQGINSYLQFLTGTGSTMNDPNLAASIEQQNALNAAAPNPAVAASTQQNDFQKYMQMITGGTGPPSGTIVDWMGTGENILPGGGTYNQPVTPNIA